MCGGYIEEKETLIHVLCHREVYLYQEKIRRFDVTQDMASGHNLGKQTMWVDHYYCEENFLLQKYVLKSHTSIVRITLNSLQN